MCVLVLCLTLYYCNDCWIPQEGLWLAKADTIIIDKYISCKESLHFKIQLSCCQGFSCLESISRLESMYYFYFGGLVKKIRGPDKLILQDLVQRLAETINRLKRHVERQMERWLNWTIDWANFDMTNGRCGERQECWKEDFTAFVWVTFERLGGEGMGWWGWISWHDPTIDWLLNGQMTYECMFVFKLATV